MKPESPLKLPSMFEEFHTREIFRAWVQADQPPYVSVLPRQPVRSPILSPGQIPWDETVTTVRVRCWNERGTMRIEAASLSDLEVAQAWARKHAETPARDFQWIAPADR